MKKLFNWTSQGYYFTDLGKIPVGGLSLSKFNAVQEPLILSELQRLTNSVEMARAIGGELLEEKLADLKIYRLQILPILRFTLYFLQIRADNKILHKIGVTSRTMSDKPTLKGTASPKGLARMDGVAKPRLKEIERDLQQHYLKIDLNVLGTWQHRGNVELYFKHRYKEFNYRIGKLTEYYKFKNIDTVLEDLCSMQPKVLKRVELEIWQELSPTTSFAILLD